MDIAIHEVTHVTVTQRKVKFTPRPFYVTTLMIYSADGTQEIKLFSNAGPITFFDSTVCTEEPEDAKPPVKKPTTRDTEPF